MPTPKQVLERYAGTVALHRGMTQLGREAFRRRLNLPPLPPEIDELLAYAEGFATDSPHDPVSFGSDHGFGGWACEGVLPLSVPMLGDGCGNYWVVDVDPQTGAWGTVFWGAHDPSVLVVQAPDLQTFITQVLDPPTPDPRKFVTDDAAHRIWWEDPWLRPVSELRDAADADEAIRTFAASLPDQFFIADLRTREIGTGFAIDLDTEVCRAGNDLIFGSTGRQPGKAESLFRRVRAFFSDR